MMEPHVIEPEVDGEAAFGPSGWIHFQVGREWIASVHGICDPVVFANLAAGHAALAATDEATFRAAVAQVVEFVEGLQPNEAFTPQAPGAARTARARVFRSKGNNFDVVFLAGTVKVLDYEWTTLTNPATRIDASEIFLDQL